MSLPSTLEDLLVALFRSNAPEGQPIADPDTYAVTQSKFINIVGGLQVRYDAVAGQIILDGSGAGVAPPWALYTASAMLPAARSNYAMLDSSNPPGFVLDLTFPTTPDALDGDEVYLQWDRTGPNPGGAPCPVYLLASGSDTIDNPTTKGNDDVSVPMPGVRSGAHYKYLKSEGRWALISHTPPVEEPTTSPSGAFLVDRKFLVLDGSGGGTLTQLLGTPYADGCTVTILVLTSAPGGSSGNPTLVLNPGGTNCIVNEAGLLLAVGATLSIAGAGGLYRYRFIANGFGAMTAPTWVPF